MTPRKALRCAGEREDVERLGKLCAAERAPRDYAAGVPTYPAPTPSRTGSPSPRTSRILFTMCAWSLVGTRRFGLIFVVVAAAAFATLTPGCADRTSLLIRITSVDLEIPDDVDRLDVTVRGLTSDMYVDRSFPALTTTWPHSVSIRPGPTEFGDVQIFVTAYRADAFVTRRVLTARFTPGFQETIEVLLERACVDVMCDEGLDCQAGRCIGMRVDAGMPDAGRDAAIDGGVDANADAPCPGGLVSCGFGNCIDPMTSIPFCGAGPGCTGFTPCVGSEICADGVCRLTCPPGQIACEGECIDPSSDRTHCGATAPGCVGGTECAAGELCAVGTCATSCPEGLYACGGRCIDPFSDFTYCGVGPDCTGGTTCLAGESCAFGVCSTTCPPGQIPCSGRCVDPLSDRNYCGARADCTGGTTCPSGQLCAGGACVASCPGGQISCGGRCVDPQTDRVFCGALMNCMGGTSCTSGQECRAGVCVTSCPPGQVACDGRCIDPETDLVYCGAEPGCVGYATCGPRQRCESSMCVCSAPESDCGGVCVDTRFDPANCGMCGRPCDATEACTSGRCSPLTGSGFTGRFGTAWTVLTTGVSLSSLQDYVPRGSTDVYGARGPLFGAWQTELLSWREETTPPIDLGTGRSFASLAGGLWMLTARDILVFSPGTREWRTTSLLGMDVGTTGMTVTDGTSLWTANSSEIVRVIVAAMTVERIPAGITMTTPRLTYDGPTGRIFYAGVGGSPLRSYDTVRSETRSEGNAPGPIGGAFCSDRAGHLYIGSQANPRQIWQYTPASGRWRDLPLIPSSPAALTNCAVSEAGFLFVAADGANELYRLDLERL
ncbi:MAG: hypothetical protein OHK0013_02640 [Sandaracinaceae bacterium]